MIDVSNLHKHALELLVGLDATDGLIIGTLGKLAHKPNRRIFELTSGKPVHQNAVTSLIRRGLLKCLHDEGNVRYFIVTEAGRSVARAYRERRVGVGRG